MQWFHYNDKPKNDIVHVQVTIVQVHAQVFYFLINILHFKDQICYCFRDIYG